GLDGDVEYHLEEHSDHSSVDSTARRRGIHPALIKEVDVLLDMAWEGASRFVICLMSHVDCEWCQSHRRRTGQDVIVLDAFAFDSFEAENWTSLGVILTSRRVLGNVITAVKDQGDRLIRSTGGTYKLHLGGWAVFAHHFVPWFTCSSGVNLQVRTHECSKSSRLKPRHFFTLTWRWLSNP
ncbi:hypothetical protein GN958_ATG00002, partial [Phytophthora infestans]